MESNSGGEGRSRRSVEKRVVIFGVVCVDCFGINGMEQTGAGITKVK